MNPQSNPETVSTPTAGAWMALLLKENFSNNNKTATGTAEMQVVNPDTNDIEVVVTNAILDDQQLSTGICVGTTNYYDNYRSKPIREAVESDFENSNKNEAPQKRSEVVEWNAALSTASGPECNNRQRPAIESGQNRQQFHVTEMEAVETKTTPISKNWNQRANTTMEQHHSQNPDNRGLLGNILYYGTATASTGTSVGGRVVGATNSEHGKFRSNLMSTDTRTVQNSTESFWNSFMMETA